MCSSLELDDHTRWKYVLNFMNGKEDEVTTGYYALHQHQLT